MNDIQLVIPMAGRGSRFADAGYSTPKPFLPIHGVPMYQIVLANLLTDQVSDVIFVARSSWNLGDVIKDLQRHLDPRLTLCELDSETDGPATTVALARPHLRLESPLITANSDQYVAQNPRIFADTLVSGEVDGLIMTMEDTDPKWSYAASDEGGYVTRVAEKVVISSQATVGIYGFSSAELFFDSYRRMVECHDTVNGEFYVAPEYNYMVANNLRVRTHHVGPVMDVMFGMGTPEDYEAFLKSPTSKLAANTAAQMFLSQ